MISLTAALSYLNYRFVKLPSTIGLTLLSLLMAGCILAVRPFAPSVVTGALAMVQSIDFRTVLLEGLLGALLFAGSLHVDINDLEDQKWAIAVFAMIGVLASTVLVGLATWWLSSVMSLGIEPIWCFLFGALISPTDPISVLAILRKIGAPRSLETEIAGEALFNDGIGVVVFLSLLRIATDGDVNVSRIAGLFLQEAVGGIVFGLLAGYAAFRLLLSIDNYRVEGLVLLALVVGGYPLAQYLNVSGPLAMVVAGLLIGNRGRRLMMSEEVRRRVFGFWEIVDEILNAILFVLIGLEVLVLSLSGRYLLAGLVCIPLTLMARLISIGIPLELMNLRRRFTPGALRILVWGALRGGISIAMALSLPKGPSRDVILTMTYVVVVFSILVQGLTVKKLIRSG